MKNKQLDILIAIKNYINKNQFSPTIREIGTIINIKSSSTVFHHLKELEKSGFLEREATLPRAMRLSEKAYEIIKAHEIINEG